MEAYTRYFYPNYADQQAPDTKKKKTKEDPDS